MDKIKKILKIIEGIGFVILGIACAILFYFIIMSCILTWAVAASVAENLSESTLHKIGVWMDIVIFCLKIVVIGMCYLLIKCIFRTKKSSN